MLYDAVMVIGAIVLAAFQRFPQVEYRLEYSYERKTYYLRVRSLDRRTVYVERNPDNYLVSFFDAKGEPVTPKQSMYADRGPTRPDEWAALAFWDEAAIPLNTDLYFPDARIKYLSIQLNEQQIVRDFEALKKEGLFLRSAGNVIFAIPSLGGPPRPTISPVAKPVKKKGGRP